MKVMAVVLPVELAVLAPAMGMEALQRLLLAVPPPALLRQYPWVVRYLLMWVSTRLAIQHEITSIKNKNW